MPELLELDEYTEMAKRLISYNGSSWMLQDEYIGIVVNYLIRSDTKYDPTKGASLKTFRFNAWKQAKQHIILDRKKNTNYIPLSEIGDVPQKTTQKKEEIKKQFKEVINSMELSATERLYLNELFVHGKKPKEICKERGVKRQAVSFTKTKAIKKLKEIYSCSGIEKKNNQETKK